MEGASTGDMTMGELKTHGDFGLGTFDGLDGEMIELDGKVFQVRADGHAHPVEDSARTPFATVSFFKADESARLDRPCDQPAMLAAVAAMLPSQNIFHALRIEGRFDYVKTRAVAKQDKSVGLEDATREEPIFEFHEVEGTIVGFFTPDYLRGVNVPGYHLHFITADRTAGGHMLDCRTKDVTIKIHHTPEFELGTPGTEEFLKADLSQDHTAAIEQNRALNSFTARRSFDFRAAKAAHCAIAPSTSSGCSTSDHISRWRSSMKRRSMQLSRNFTHGV